MSRELLSDLVTEEIEAVMRERAERSGENHLVDGWLIDAFARAFADPEIKRDAARRALRRFDAGERPGERRAPRPVVMQEALFGRE